MLLSESPGAAAAATAVAAAQVGVKMLLKCGFNGKVSVSAIRSIRMDGCIGVILTDRCLLDG